MSQSLSEETIRSILRASKRSAATVHEEMKEGLNGLAILVSVAPWAGVFGTVLGIVESFPSCGGERSACMAVVAERLSVSWVCTALGLAVALTSLWCYRYLSGQLEAFDREMEIAPLDLVNRLSRYRGRWSTGQAIERLGERTLFGAASAAELRQDANFWRRSMYLTGSALLVAWLVQVARGLEYDSLPLGSAAWTAGRYVLFSFGVSCLPAHALWVKLLHRRRGGLVAPAAIFCACWCVIQLVWAVRVFEP